MFAARRILGRIRELFVLTNLGVVVLAASAAAYFLFAVPRVDYAVQLVSVLAAALVVFAVLVVALGALLTHLSVKRATRGEATPIRFEAVRGFSDALSLPARRWFPLLEITWTWEEPVGVDVERASVGANLLEQVSSPSRGYAKTVRRKFVIEDGFGLARIVLRKTETRDVKIVPWSGALNRSPLLRSLASGDDLPHPMGRPDGDRVDMRRYVPGDPLRLALWKTYARTRVLMVRQSEKAIAPAVRVAAYLPSVFGDEAAAAAARVAVEGGLLGDRWVFGADGATRPAEDAEESIQQIVASRAVRDTPAGGGAGLTAFLDAASETEPARVVLFVPGHAGPWLDTVTSVIQRHRGTASAVIVVDGVETDEVETRRVDRILRVPDEAEARPESVVTQSSIGAVARTLAAAGAEVGAVDRKSGRSIHLGLGGGRAMREDIRSVA